MRTTLLSIGLAGVVFVAQVPGQGPALAEIHEVLPLTSDLGRGAVAADVDGDGLQDLVLIGSGGRSQIWRALPDGGFAVVRDAFQPPPNPGEQPAFVLTDIDQDGDIDACVLDRSSTWTTSPSGGGSAQWFPFGGLVRTYVNDGTGSFSLTATFGGVPTPFLGPAELSSCIAAGDIDADGDVDLLVGVQPVIAVVSNGLWQPPSYYLVGGQDRLWTNQGDGSFVDATDRLPADQDSARSVLFADVDGDGDLDAYIGNVASYHPGSPIDRLYRNNGSGWFSNDASFPWDWADNRAAWARDFDLDGDLDLLVHDEQQVRLLTNSGSGSFTVGMAPSLAEAFAAYAGDLDGDGSCDYALRTVTSWLPVLNDGAGGFAAAPARAIDLTGMHAQSMLLGDFEHDGDLDLFAIPDELRGSRLWRNSSSAPWRSVDPDVTQRPSRAAAVASGDVDGDGLPDLLLVAAATPGSNTFYRNQGDGRFVSEPAGDFTVDQQNAHAIAVGDLDADGDLDVVVASEHSFGVGSRVYRNTGGVFSRENLAFPSSQSALDVAIGDLDGDGDMDLYFCGGTASDQVLLNQGGAFVVSAAAVPASVRSTGVVLADLDDDGDLDAVVAYSGQPVLLNDGSGAFATSTTSAMVSPSSRDIVVGDFDGDLDVDLVFDGRLWRNDGSGTFVSAPTPLTTVLGCSACRRTAAGDFDSDGDLDLLRTGHMFNGSWQPPVLYTNDGTGSFTVRAGSVDDWRIKPIDVLVSDLDGDSDPDAAVLIGGAPRIWWNTRRQIAWRHLPRVGSPLTLDLYGRAGEPYALGLAFAPASLPLPGLGTLRLDPASLRIMACGAYDPAGRAVFDAPVPAIPALIDLTVYWQAVSGAQPSLGNVEVTRLLAP